MIAGGKKSTDHPRFAPLLMRCYFSALDKISWNQYVHCNNSFRLTEDSYEICNYCIMGDFEQFNPFIALLHHLVLQAIK